MEISGDLVSVIAFGELILPMMWLARDEVLTHNLVKVCTTFALGGSVANFDGQMLLIGQNDRVQNHDLVMVVNSILLCAG